MIEQSDIDEAGKYSVLGPQYFAARRIAERFMEKFEVEHFKPLIEKAVSEFHDKLWEGVVDSFLYDTEGGLQSRMWEQIDASVEALLSGEPWALQRYCLGNRYDQEKVRAAVAKHIPQELQDKRIADLEAQLARANETIASLNRMYR